MKPIWTQTLVWLAAVAAAVLLALATPDNVGFSFDPFDSSTAPVAPLTPR